MELSRSLQRQLTRSCGVDAAGLWEQEVLQAAQGGPVTERVRAVLAGLPRLLTQVNDTYLQHERDVSLAQRSLDLSSQELTEANQRLWAERMQMERSLGTLRETLDGQGALAVWAATGERLPAADGQPSAELETVSRQVGQLVHDMAAARDALRLSEERLALAVQSSGVGLWDWNLETDAVYFSPEWEGMLGYAAGVLVPNAQTLVGLLHPEDGIRFGETMGAYFSQTQTDVYRDDVRLRCADGSYKWVEFKGRIVEMTPDGEPRRATGVSLDISARKALEHAMAQAQAAAEAASQAKGDFLANMSHEIRTPMNGVLGLTELCLSTEMTAEQRGYLEMVQSSAHALLTVINDVLDFSKIEANRLDIERIPFDLGQAVRHAMAPLRHRAKRAGLELQADLPQRLPLWRLGDPARLRQVLVNLVGNSIKFTEAGHVTLTVEPVPAPVGAGASGEPPVAEWLQFEVSDTGIGMTPEQQEKVFEAFAQADTSISRRFGGTGLGLTITQRLVKLMGGELKVRSVSGQGTTFWFALPMPLTELPQAGTLPVPEVTLPSGLRVLVAEDHPINQVVARKVLEHFGMTVTVVSNGLQAVEACAADRFDLVFMDIQMPELDGFEATRRVRAHELQKGLTPVPIVAMTAHAMEGYRQRCEAGGMDGYVTKPIERKWLVKELQRVLARAGRM